MFISEADVRKSIIIIDNMKATLVNGISKVHGSERSTELQAGLWRTCIFLAVPDAGSIQLPLSTKLPERTGPSFQREQDQASRENRTKLPERTGPSFQREQDQASRENRTKLPERTGPSFQREQDQASRENRTKLPERTGPSFQREQDQASRENRTRLPQRTGPSFHREQTFILSLGCTCRSRQHYLMVAGT